MVLAGAAVLTAPPAPAATRTVTVTPVADTSVRADQPTTPGGTSGTLTVDASPVHHSFLKFTVTGVGADVVTSATLRLYVNDAGPVGGTFSRVADNTWSETGMTWATQPPADTSPLATLGAVKSKTWYELDVSSLVRADGTVSIRATTTSSDKVTFKSREAKAAQRPQLVVSVESVPDTADPSATITDPADGATVSGIVDVAVDATDDRGVSAVTVRVDGTVVGTDSSAPFVVAWDTSSVGNGTHVLTAVAQDLVGKTGTSVPVSVTVDNVAPPPTPSVTVTAAGDMGAGTRATASLATLDRSGADLFLALGDLSYGETPTEQAWCDYVRANTPTLGSSFPFQVVTGNHEEQGALDGYILNFAQCLPDRLGSTVAPQSHYGSNYYFDYPAANPLVRVFMISPDHTVDNVTYKFSAGDAHFNWLAAAIDDGRAAGVPWTIVGMHKPCISSSSAGCSIGQPLWNLLLDKRVDLVLAGHNHNYQRSKQLALKSGCPSFVLGGFSQACVADSGTGVMGKGAGTVFSIVGNFGRTGSTINPADPEAGYFASTDGVTNGFMTFTLTPSRLDAHYTATSGSFTDSYAISIGGGSNSDQTPPSAPTGLTAVANGGDRVNLSWNPSTDNVTVDHYRILRDGVQVGTTSGTAYSDGFLTPGTTYAYVVRAVDAAGNVSDPSEAVSVTTAQGSVVSFDVTDDATIRVGAPTTNYGTSTTLSIDGSPVEHAVLKVAVDGIGSGTVTGAKLRLFNAGASRAGGDFYATADNGWTEKTVTWDTAPAATGSPLASLGSVATNTWYEVDLTALIQRDGIYSLRVTTTSTDGVKWTSRQGAAGTTPQLVVTLAP